MARNQTRHQTLAQKAAPAGKAQRAPAPAGRQLGLTRRQRRRLASAGAVLALLAVVVGGLVLYDRLHPLPGEFVASQGNRHIPTADTPHEPYSTSPPTSGPHLPHMAPWGVHTRPIAKQLQVHNLEDGGVVVSYKPECAERVLDTLMRVVSRYSEQVLLAPYPELDRCVALTAWQRIDKFDDPDEARIIRFIDAYRGIDHHPH